MRTLSLLAFASLALVVGCGSSNDSTTNSTTPGAAGASGHAGGSTGGGSNAGGSTSGGSNAGGSTAAGATSGGASNGGSNAGGSTSGGSTSGGSTSGGSTSGGSTSGGSTGGGSGPGGSAGATAGGAGGAGGDCANPTPITDAQGNDTGYARCENGSIIKVATVSITPVTPAGSCKGQNVGGAGGAGGAQPFGDCTEDADCTEHPYGHCDVSFGDFGPVPSCGCVYECEHDADCGDGATCIPAGVIDGTTGTTCGADTCNGPADCASQLCSLSAFDNGCGLVAGLYCHAPTDACQTDADCAPETGDDAPPEGGGGLFGPSCAWDPNQPSGGAWACQSTSCAF